MTRDPQSRGEALTREQRRVLRARLKHEHSAECYEAGPIEDCGEHHAHGDGCRSRLLRCPITPVGVHDLCGYAVALLDEVEEWSVWLARLMGEHCRPPLMLGSDDALERVLFAEEVARWSRGEWRQRANIAEQQRDALSAQVRTLTAQVAELRLPQPMLDPREEPVTEQVARLNGRVEALMRERDEACAEVAPLLRGCDTVADLGLVYKNRAESAERALDAERTARVLAQRATDGAERALETCRGLLREAVAMVPVHRESGGTFVGLSEDWRARARVAAALGESRGKASAPYYLIERNDHGRAEWAAWPGDALTWVTDVHAADRYEWHLLAERHARIYRGYAALGGVTLTVTEHIDVAALGESPEGT